MNTIQKIQNACIRGRMSLPDAVAELNNVLGGITSVHYKEGTKFKIGNGNNYFAIPIQGVSKKELQKLHGLAVGAYYMAQKNGSRAPGEVHISRKASTCHHMEGINSIRGRYYNAA